MYFQCYGDHRELHVLTHSYPTRLSSDLVADVELRRLVLAARHLVGVLDQAGRIVREPELDAGLEQPRGEDHHQQRRDRGDQRSEEHTSELQSLMRISYAVFCLKKKK